MVFHVKHFSKINYINLLKKTSYIYRGNLYADDIIVFDIETTSCWLTQDGKVVPDCNIYDEKWYNEQTPIGVPYEWTMNINGTSFYGRHLEDACTIFKELGKSKKKRCVYVHNLGFEFVFLTSFLTPDEVFARQSRHPLKVIFKECLSLEFRCTYMLTRLSLRDWGKSIGKTQKESGFDYSKIRTPLTDLTNREMTYCENDVVVMYEGLMIELNRYGHIKDIPLTQTGKVRKEIKKILCTPDYLKFMCTLVPSFKIYQLLVQAYWGGFTHGNYLYVGRIIEDVLSFDFKSSYPFCMGCCKFPMTPFEKVTKIRDTERYAYLIHVKFTNIKSKKFNTFLSASKCINKKRVIRDNGRVIEAEMVEVTMTELDYEIFKKCYNYETEEIIEVYESKKDYLPRDFIIYMLSLYKKKTELKDIPEMEEIYAKAKEFLNALYGMMCSALIYDRVKYKHDGNWKNIKNTENQVKSYIEDLKEKPNRKNFVAYQWGVWTIAWARYHLWVNILRNDKGNIYSDTDSNKIIAGTQKKFEKQHNDYVMRKINESAKANNIPLEMFMPKDKYGKQHILGSFDNDGNYEQFITLGAKRYAYRDKKDGKLHITVSGVPKGAVCGLDDCIDNFNDGFVFKRNLVDKNDLEVKTVSSLLYYTNNQPKVVINKDKYDEYKVTNSNGIAVRRKSYTMGLTSEFLNFLIDKQKNRKGCRVIER